ncbi:MAG: hypothetical protein GON13_01365 [Nanoarchaeota archaeon]|nr:hypothetical protein [Nanoarchaeota archaeon]
MSGDIIFGHGPDKAGKGTQLSILAYDAFLKGYDVEYYTFPDYSTIGGLLVDQHLRGEKEIPREVATIFYALDRAYQAKYIKQAKQNGKIVICKRSKWSNAAYGQVFLGLPFNDILGIDVFFPDPDIAALIDLPDQVLSSERNRDKKDRYEKKDQTGVIEFLRKAHANGNEISDKLKANYRFRINGRNDLIQVFDNLKSKIYPALKSKPNSSGKGSLLIIGRQEPLELEIVNQKSFGEIVKEYVNWEPQKIEIKTLNDLFKHADIQNRFRPILEEYWSKT